MEAKLLIGADQYSSANFVFDQDKGTIFFQAPVLNLKDYTAQLHLRDTKGRYLSNIIDITIPKAPGPIVNIGNIVMITPSGNGCHGEAAACFDQKEKKGDLKVTAYDGFTSTKLSGVKIRLYRHFTSTDKLIKTLVSDENGFVNFNELLFGYYKVELNKDGYKLSPNKVYHDLVDNKIDLFIFSETASPMTLLMKSGDINTESDIVLDIKTKTGKTCTVSAENKFCPFAEHRKDVIKGQIGYEYIDV
jgi:Prealbumin-like fold domain